MKKRNKGKWNKVKRKEAIGNIGKAVSFKVRWYLLLDATSSAVAANARIFATVDRKTDTQLIFIWWWDVQLGHRVLCCNFFTGVHQLHNNGHWPWNSSKFEIFDIVVTDSLLLRHMHFSSTNSGYISEIFHLFSSRCHPIAKKPLKVTIHTLTNQNTYHFWHTCNKRICLQVRNCCVRLVVMATLPAGLNWYLELGWAICFTWGPDGVFWSDCNLDEQKNSIVRKLLDS